MLNIELGAKVINKAGEVGTIISIGDHIQVDFGQRTTDYTNDAFINGFLKYVDEKAQKVIDDEIIRLSEEEDMKKEKRKIADETARKRAAEFALQKARNEAAKKTASDKRAKNINKGKKSRPIHPYIDRRRREGKPVVFMVCQNYNYGVESNGGYIWAPDHKAKGETDLASHAEMDLVKAGDIIIHHFSNRIYAISVAKKDCERKPATTGHPNCGVVGRFVELNYHFLKNQADTTGLKNEKVIYGSMKYGPFERTGKNKEGFYLSELADEIASAFIDAAILANPTDTDLLDFKKKI